jgi:ABC-type multidrug transport system fused ATPase/permease subunit
VLATYQYPLLDFFWTMCIFFLWVVWIWILITVFIDIFRSPDMGGGLKALWFIFVLLVPFLGVLIYLIARGHKMQEHQLRAAQQQQEMMDEYIKTTAAGGSTADELSKLADLKAKGTLTDAEYEAAKAKLLT